ncbi:MAG: SH3 domain-containing protein [Candidatus Omnitrophota bacterium]
MKKIILIITVLLSIAGTAFSEELKPLDQNKLFYSANSFYEKRDYEKALNEYKKILDMGIESGALYYNIGNCYFKLGKLGYAILFYDKAERIIPQDGDLKSNLSYAMSLVGASSADAPRKNPIVSVIKAPFMDLNLNGIAIFALAIYIVFIVLQIAGIVNPVFAKKTRLLYIITFSFFVVSLGAFAIRYYDEDIVRRGVVVQRGVECRYEPIDKSNIFYKLQEGERVSVLKTRDGWRRVRRLDGKTGWVRQETVDEI